MCPALHWWQARHEAARCAGLEAEVRVLMAAEQRASSELAALTSDKFRLAAELEAARRAHADREERLAAELRAAREEVRVSANGVRFAPQTAREGTEGGMKLWGAQHSTALWHGSTPSFQARSGQLAPLPKRSGLLLA